MAIVSGNVSVSVEAQFGTVVVCILSFSRCGNRIYFYVITLNPILGLPFKMCVCVMCMCKQNQLQCRPDDGGFYF